MADASEMDIPDAHPAELALLSDGAVASRRLTFSLGREAARRAFAELSNERKPVLLNADGSPRWPDGFVGSISHTDELAVAAVSPTDQTARLGIDLEDLRRNVPEDVAALIADDCERSWIAGDHEKLLRIFSAKEAIFKAFYPEVGIFFGFEAAHLDWIGCAFIATLSISGADGLISGRCLVRSQRREHLLLSSVYQATSAEATLMFAVGSNASDDVA